MEEAVSCGFESLGIIGLIVGGMIVSMSYSLFKNNKSNMEKPIEISDNADKN